MNTKRFDNMNIETAINSIKQKHFTDLDAEDYAFLKARQDYLSEADKAIYLNGENPVDVIVETTPLTREERIINENRPLQDREFAVRGAKNEAYLKEVEAYQPLVGEARTEADEKLIEDRADKAESLAAEVTTLEKEETKAEKDRVAEAKKADAEEKKEAKK